LDAGESSPRICGLDIIAVPAVHDPPDRDAEGHFRCLGYVIRGTFTVYHSGDGRVHPGMVERLRAFNVDVALLPINGKVGNMNGREAAWLAKEIGAKLVIPCHYDMFEFNTADPRDEFIPECERLGQPYKVLRAGERWSSP
jgi:L-ascorbate metabolism protein UlaG (beta-lactamase superfamily)